MRLKTIVCTCVAALALAAQAMAAPLAAPFLAVDINGYNADGGQSKGPTAAGFQDFEAGQGAFVAAPVNWGSSGAAGLTNVYATTEGNITANLKGIALNSSLLARNRGANAGANSDMHQDFAAAQNGGVGFGQNFVRLQLSGLVPNKKYEITMYARESAFASATDHIPTAPLASFQSWTDKAALGGLDGPGAWLDANVGAGATYQGIWVDDDMDAMTPDVNTGYKNPIPSKARSLVSGPDSLSQSDPYIHGGTFETTADAGGVVVVYGWSDANSYNGSTVQRASLLSGFQIGGAVPEPATFGMIAVGLAGLGCLRRRSR
jgi:hypothetical protein